MVLGKFPISANVPTHDIERAAAFYRDVLGLTVETEHYPEAVFFECGDGTRLEVFMTRGEVGSSHTEAGFHVTDIEGVVRTLKDRGVEFEDYDLGEGMGTVDGILDADGDRVAWFKDPDGNTIGLFEPGQASE